MQLARFASFWIYPSAALALLAASRAVEPGRAWSELLGLALVGLLSWSLLEYLLHRFVFHAHYRRPWLRRLQQGIHTPHHLEPRNPEHIFVRLSFSLPVSALLLVFLYGISGSLSTASALMAGFWLGFLYYEGVHYRLHFSKAAGGLIRHQRRWHFYHHFVDERHCFGVTSPLWDWVFGTRKPAEKPTTAN